MKLVNASVMSQIQDLDYAEALSRLSLQSTIMDAAQQSYVKIQGLSLFNYSEVTVPLWNRAHDSVMGLFGSQGLDLCR
ncbi:hypothetical protein ACPA9J_12515 [Pseudomonas aeruginosa]